MYKIGNHTFAHPAFQGGRRGRHAAPRGPLFTNERGLLGGLLAGGFVGLFADLAGLF